MLKEPIGPWSVIYRIRNTVNGKKYIGSTCNGGARFAHHQARLKRGVHDSPILQAAFNKYGDAAFVFEIIEYVPPDALTSREQHYLDQRPEYNCCFVVGGRFRTGMKATPQHSANMSAALKGRKSPMEGKKHSDATKAIMSAAQMGKTGTPNRAKLEGLRFGRWLVDKFEGVDNRGEALWSVICDCGAKKTLTAYVLTAGLSKSCGCYRKQWKTGVRNPPPCGVCAAPAEEVYTPKGRFHGYNKFCADHSRKKKFEKL